MDEKKFKEILKCLGGTTALGSFKELDAWCRQCIVLLVRNQEERIRWEYGGKEAVERMAEWLCEKCEGKLFWKVCGQTKEGEPIREEFRKRIRELLKVQKDLPCGQKLKANAFKGEAKT